MVEYFVLTHCKTIWLERFLFSFFFLSSLWTSSWHLAKILNNRSTLHCGLWFISNVALHRQLRFLWKRSWSSFWFPHVKSNIYVVELSSMKNIYSTFDGNTFSFPNIVFFGISVNSVEIGFELLKPFSFTVVVVSLFSVRISEWVSAHKLLELKCAQLDVNMFMLFCW